MIKKMNIVSLFSGCGGLDLGFEKAGFNVVWANEYDKTIHETFRFNHPNTVLNTDDIRNLSESDIPDCDGIIGGPPCQSWSEGGKQLGINDPRGQLFWEYISIVNIKKPKFFVIENVQGILEEKHKDSLRLFTQSLINCGYRLSYELLNAADYKVPQDRYRVFFIGIRKDLKNTFDFPNSVTSTPITLKQAIGDIIETPRFYNDDIVDSDNTIRPNHDVYNGRYDDKYMARNRVRSWDEPSFTIQAQARNAPQHPQAPKMTYISQDKRIFAKGYEHLYRRLSVRECARIQTFPDSFRFYYKDVKDGYKMVGNAVPPRMAFYLAQSIKECLKNSSNDFTLVGYVKTDKDMSVIRKQKVYYIRGGNRPDALSFGQLDCSIKWLLLHRNGNRYYFELENNDAVSCDRSYLKNLGFSPQGETYWLFKIKRELSQDEINDTIKNIDVPYTNKPQIVKV